MEGWKYHLSAGIKDLLEVGAAHLFDMESSQRNLTLNTIRWVK